MNFILEFISENNIIKFLEIKPHTKFPFHSCETSDPVSQTNEILDGFICWMEKWCLNWTTGK